MPNNMLIFVYNADSGFFNTLSDIAHKITSPDTYQCKLCSLTHGYFTIKGQWQEFLDHTNTQCEFLHRDEFIQQYANTDEPLPAVFMQTGQGLQVVINKQQLETLEDVKQLIELVNNRS